MSEKKITRLRELADVVTKGKESWHEFSMCIPADPDRDADLILTWAADEIEQLRSALHASAPEGHKCADCTIDEEPCPTCYAAWWQQRHPNHQEIVLTKDSRQQRMDELGITEQDIAETMPPEPGR